MANEDRQERVGLVLAGGGARGAYEVGVISALLPALERAGQLPNVVVGTSVGALNAAFVAANIHRRPLEEALAGGRRVWTSVAWGDVLADPSAGDIARIAQYAGGVLGFGTT